ncbi:MAG: DUF2281 domain-containing protein [Chlamydiae bacterium]|nr:DUF2281 domain-containing protein [Chlamydiota bacterium]MBI3265683.1 DUF2281 domain-containing protein [Chlamydiota bacterium]
MTKRELLIGQIQKVPDSLIEEVLDFISFLKSKVLKEKHHPLFISESSLQKDWLRPEEEESWKNL